MLKFVLLFVAAAVAASPVYAHHKPGHHMPPGQAKKLVVEVPVPPPVLDAAVGVRVTSEMGWRRYADDEYGFEIDLPLGLFDRDESASRGLRLFETDGVAEIQTYGADNPRGLPPRDFVTALEGADRIAEITYRAEGPSWFVLSGYYADDEGLEEPLIFYTKFMFSADRSRVSAFEISYPVSEKARFDRIVSRIEKSLTAPG